MTETPSHDKKMKNFMGAEGFVTGVKQGQLQCIEDASCCIDQSSGQQPCKSRGWKCCKDLLDCQDADPSHADVEYGRKPFGAGDPECLDDDPHQCDAPDQSQKHPASPVTQHDQADGGIGSCDQDKDHHMVDFFQDPVDLWRDIQGMVERTGSLE